MKTSARPRGRRLNGRKPQHASAPASANASDSVIRVNGHGVDREEEERDRGERRGEPVHVVEQVEGVRDPDEPDDARSRRRPRSFVDQLDVRAGREDDRRRGALRRELRERRQRCERSSTRPARKTSVIAAVDAANSRVELERADRGRDPEPGAEADEDADPAEDRRRSSRASGRRTDGDEAPGRAGIGAAPRSRPRSPAGRRSPTSVLTDRGG